MSAHHRVYPPESVREMDRRAIQDAGIPGYELMCRAGAAACDDIRRCCPDAVRWLVLCGAGNNAGDGYVVARLGRDVGIEVTVATLVEPESLSGDAAQALRDWQASGGEVVSFDEGQLALADVVVDALLGTGLARSLEGAWAAAVDAVNASGVPVIALDIPSGLNGETGHIMGTAIRAMATPTFVGLKQGLFLGAGPDCVGEVFLHDLEIPGHCTADIDPSMRVFGAAELATLLPPRPATAHKGQHGHVLVVGGNRGMAGAARLAGEAALRAGAGLVTVATRPENVYSINTYRPELMSFGVDEAADLQAALARATVVAIGPGLGQDSWARALFEQVIAYEGMKVLDADALNLLAEAPRSRDDWVLTPHPGEAGRLLGCSASEVQADRLGAVAKITARFGGTVLLKGRGTLVGQAGELPFLIDRGNPGMATAGMGDLLTGVLAAIVGQAGPNLQRCAAAAAFAHATAGDRAAEQGGQRGLLATDLLPHIRAILNGRS